MKKRILIGSCAAVLLLGGVLFAADHTDAPAVTGPGNTSLNNDVADLFAFQSPTDNSKMVFVLTWQGLMSPAKTAITTIPNNQLFEFNIDNNGDNVEDLVIQAKVQDGKLRVYGPVAPASVGTASTIVTTGPVTEGAVTTYGQDAMVATGSNGIKAFIGPRDDPFFFDIARFKEILAGTQTSFRNPGMDTFAGTNILALVVEVPKSMLGTAATINVWTEIKMK
jgi:hypothetical protein